LIELQTRDASAVGKNRGLGELAKFLAVHKGFQDILLHVQIVVDDATSSPLDLLPRPVSMEVKPASPHSL